MLQRNEIKIKIIRTLILNYMFFVLSAIVFARGVKVSDVYLSDINPDDGTAIINYTLTRAQPEITAQQPIWIFVKYRLSTESDYLDWKDTDDTDYTNDNSDGRFKGNDDNSKNRCDDEYPCTVNVNLSGDVNMVESGGDKQILWIWGEGGTGLSSADDTIVAVYPIEMVKIEGGEITFGFDSYAWNHLTGGSAAIDDFYMMKYPCTVEMYAAFLNSCANRHDPQADSTHDFYYAPGMNGDSSCRLRKISGRIGTNAVFAAVSGYENFAMTYTSWYNAYDFAKWSGLRMVTSEEFEYEATNKGTRYWPWGNDKPGPDNRRANKAEVDPDNASDVRIYDEYAEPPNKPGVSINGAADMAGNVGKWTFTVWYEGEYDSNKSSEDESGYGVFALARIVHGLAWAHDSDFQRGASRPGYLPDNKADPIFGFVLGHD